MAKVLIIDDDPKVNALFSEIVDDMGHAVSNAYTVRDGIKKAGKNPFDVVFLDVHLPDGNGLEALPKIRKSESVPEVIIITGFGDPESAELAIRNDAWDYITKPASVGNLTLSLNRALEYRKEKTSKKNPLVLNRKGIIGKSPRLNAVLERVAQAAASRANVLITGETGTGKELLARAIHMNSPVAGKRFVVVDCAALPETLVESILFGHEKGAYTGADNKSEGLIMQADGGTLFLDEVGELPISIQKAFLRVIQERRFRAVKGNRELNAEFRLIAATNRDLNQMAKEGKFRSDLLYRLQSLSITSPALRDRPEDIRDLAVHQVNRLCDIYAAGTKGLSKDFLDALTVYDWPGNVRELFNLMEEVLSKAMGDATLYPHHMPVNIRAKIARMSINSTLDRNSHTEANPDTLSCDALFKEAGDGNFPSIKAFRYKMERQYLKKLLSVTNGSRKQACVLSGLSRTRLFELLKKYGLSSIH